jgi:hypothetical protein
MAAIHALAFDRPWSAPEIAQMLASPGVLGFLCHQEGPRSSPSGLRPGPDGAGSGAN